MRLHRHSPTLAANQRSQTMQQSYAFETLLLPAEAAKRLRLAEGTLAVWRCTQRQPLRYVKVGSRVFYRACDIDAYLQSRMQAA
jgi:hypothetical protein